jgi:hypothetical protein
MLSKVGINSSTWPDASWRWASVVPADVSNTCAGPSAVRSTWMLMWAAPAPSVRLPPAIGSSSILVSSSSRDRTETTRDVSRLPPRHLLGCGGCGGMTLFSRGWPSEVMVTIQIVQTVSAALLKRPGRAGCLCEVDL